MGGARGQDLGAGLSRGRGWTLSSQCSFLEDPGGSVALPFFPVMKGS